MRVTARPSPFLKEVLPQPIREAVSRLVWTVKGSMRCLPNFLIIGAQKAGTTSLYSYLCDHPQIVAATRKEPQFFTMHYTNGVMWYRSMFPLKVKMLRGQLTGEATPYYLFHPHAPSRILELVPGAKLIVLLRDPVDRAISHYYDVVRHKREVLSMEEAFLNEESRIEPELLRMEKDEYYNSDIYRNYSYRKRGIYVDQLARFRNYLDSDQLLIVKSEEFFCDPKKTLRDVFTFMNIDESFVPCDLRPRNIGSYTNNVSPLVYNELVNYYDPHNTRLYQFLGRDFGWKRP